MKSAQERGEFGAWLVEQRQRLGRERGKALRQQDVVAELREQGFPLDDSYYRALEGGSKKPGREVRERLGDYFAAEPPEPGGRRGDAEISELVGAIREQVAAVNALTGAIQALIAVQATSDEDRMRELVEDLARGGLLGPELPQLLADTRP